MGAVKAHDVRWQLARLIRDGLRGRSYKTLYRQLVIRFEQYHQTLSQSCFDTWVAGASFPSNRFRQNLLADVVGGLCGKAIRELPGPAFRGWRRRVMKEDHSMTATHGSNNTRSGTARHFPHIPHKGDDGRTHQRPMITCAGCGAKQTVVRNGAAEAAELFEKRGWEVGKTEAHDYCPMCVKARSRPKVVKMSEHVKTEENNKPPVAEGIPAELTMSKEEGRILSRFIDDHWDAAGERYQAGWSDRRLAEEVNKPVSWVTLIRERDFGGTGDDPSVADFVAEQVAISTELGMLKATMDELAASVAVLAGEHEKVQRIAEKYRDAHNALQTKVKRLSEVADRVRPFKAA